MREVLGAGAEEPFLFGFFDIERLVELALARLTDTGSPPPLEARMGRFDVRHAISAYDRLISPPAPRFPLIGAAGHRAVQPPVIPVSQHA